MVSNGPARPRCADTLAEIIDRRDGAQLRSVVQPIVRIDDRGIVGYEALARVLVAPVMGPTSGWRRQIGSAAAMTWR
jgi:hypothetical protein